MMNDRNSIRHYRSRRAAIRRHGVAASWRPLELAILLAAMLVCLWSARSVAAKRLAQFALPVNNVIDVQADAGAADTLADQSDRDFDDGPSLATDSDVQRLLLRAREYIADRRFDLAVTALQQTLDQQFRSAEQDAPVDAQLRSLLITRDAWKHKVGKNESARLFQVYRSVADEVERVLRQLPREGISVYRLTVDGQAKKLLASGEEVQLAEVVRRYFMSSYGDDAAFRLGCLLIEKRDFVGASRMFAKLLEHPALSIPRDQVLLRLAVSNARLGDVAAARDAFDAMGRLAQDGTLTVSPLARDLVEREVAGRAAGIDPDAATAAGAWPMKLGGPSRRGVMPAPAIAPSAAYLHDTWDDPVEFNLGLQASGLPAAAPPANPRFNRMFRGGMIMNSVPTLQLNVGTVSREHLVKRWREARWSPVSHVVLDQGRLYFKTYHAPPPEREYRDARPRVQLKCYDAHGGELVWERSWFHQDAPAGGGQPQQAQHQVVNPTPSDQPRTREEVMLFGDRAGSDLSIIGDAVYTLEGAVELSQTVNRWQGRAVSQLGVSTNRLFAWAKGTGDRGGWKLWDRGGDVDPETGEETPVKFLAAPLPLGERLIVPVRQSGSLWIYALQPGRAAAGGWQAPTVWKTFLCDEPPGGVSPWTTVGVAVGGGDIYVSSGAGVVFTLDGLSGHVRWATRYRRSVLGSQANVVNQRAMMQMGMQMGMGMHVQGWDEDAVIPHGRHLIVMPSDATEIFAFDRRSGEGVWRAEASETQDAFQYCLGVTGDSVFVGGPGGVSCYDLGQRQGSLAWHWSGEVLGRAAVTTGGIYVPVNDTIVKLSLEDRGGGLRQQVAVYRAAYTGNDPLGNLFSDGRRIVALGLDRLTVLSSIGQRIEELEERIKQGDLAARRQRVSLLAKSDRLAEAVAELAAIYQQSVKLHGDVAAREALVGGMIDLDLAFHDPVKTLQLLAAVGGDWSGMSPDHRNQRVDLLLTALRRLTAAPAARTGAAQLVLRVLPQCDAEYLAAEAVRALRSVATVGDAPLLRESLRSERVVVRVAAIGALAALPGVRADVEIKPLLAAAEDPVRLAAAKALVDLKDQDGLTTLVALLAADRVETRAQAVAALRAVSARQFAFVTYDAPAAREASVAAWRRWVQQEARTARWRLPLADSGVSYGRTLVSLGADRRVVELDAGGGEVFVLENVDDATGCQGLANGHRLVASYSEKWVAEFDGRGRQVWIKRNLPGQPASLQRLENENLLIACVGKDCVIEVDPGGTIVWQRDLAGQPRDARRVAGDRTLVALSGSGQVVEIDRAGKVQWTLADVDTPVSVRRLDGGNTLVVQSTGSGVGRVVEYDREKKRVREFAGLSRPHDAQRLANGDTLVVVESGLAQFNLQGEMVWEKKIAGARRVHRW